MAIQAMPQPAGTASPDAEMFEIEAWCDLVAAAPPGFAAAVGLAVERVAGAVCVVAPGIPSIEFNRAVGLGVRQPATSEDVVAVADIYRQRGVKRAVIQLIAGGTQPPQLPQWLEHEGATRVTSRWVVCETRGPAPQAPVSALQIRELGQADALTTGEVFRLGYGLPPPFALWTAGLIGRPNWRGYGAFEGGALIGVGFLYRIGRRAAMLGAATLPEARGRGAQTGLLARRLKDAFDNGAAVVQSHTGVPGPGQRNPSLDNMHRAGLMPVHVRDNYELRG